jgi:hypothetical protein
MALRGKEYRSRFADAPWIDFKEEIMIGGVGGIGRLF